MAKEHWELGRCYWDDPEYRRQWQRDYRQSLRDRGGCRVDIHIQPCVMQVMGILLKDYDFANYPGPAIARWLFEECGPGGFLREWSEDEGESEPTAS